MICTSYQQSITKGVYVVVGFDKINSTTIKTELQTYYNIGFV
jgi:hypothetical protein